MPVQIGLERLRDINAVYLGFRMLYERHIVNDDKPVSRIVGRVPETDEKTLRALRGLLERDFLAFLVPFDSDLPLDHPENYYMEREWRKYGYLYFRPDDVEHIWVVAGYADRLVSDIPWLPRSKITEIA